jgi:hypothetical protein
VEELKEYPRFSKSCKQFNKKKSIGFFIHIYDPDEDTVKPREMIRIQNRKEGEFYLFPRPLDHADFHISYHKTGEFHWKLDKEYHFPKEDERDFRVAFRDYLSIQAHTGWIFGYCIAVDRRVERRSLARMLQILSGYVPWGGLDSPEALDDIANRRHVTQPNPFVKVPEEVFSPVPAASGVLLAELKAEPGKLHTLNLTLTEEGVLLVHRRVNPKDAGEEPSGAGFLDKEDIEVAHVVLM